jgi:hypothetical protein
LDGYSGGFSDVSVEVFGTTSKIYLDDGDPVADIEKKVERSTFKEGQRFNRTNGTLLGLVHEDVCAFI